MLRAFDRKRLEDYIDSFLNEIRILAENDIKKGYSKSIIVNNVINMTVEKVTPETKMLLTSTYYLLEEQTLEKEIYSNPHNKAAFYERDILKELEEKFDFKIPENFTLNEGREKIKKLEVAGVIVVSSGAISLLLDSFVPLGLGVGIVLVGIMAYTIQNNSKNNIEKTVNIYLSNVKNTLMQWILNIVDFYESKVKELEEGFA